MAGRRPGWYDRPASRAPETIMPEPTLVRDATCTACGCLCDDIALTTDGDRIVEAENACAIGRDWFLADHARGDRPAAAIDGQSATFDEAVAKAAAILKEARSPMVLGLVGATMEAQRAAVALADRIGATIDPGRSSDSLPRWRAVQRVGMVSATLGEVRDRADLVVFWGVDPAATHPRHLERYSGEPIGRFVPEGRRGRTIVVVDAEPGQTKCDRFVFLDPERHAEALSDLRMIVNGITPNTRHEALDELAHRMKTARYGAFFFGAMPGGTVAVEEALKLVRDLNRHTRFVALTMGARGNLAGAEAVLSWQAGSPRAVDFSGGSPRFLPDEATAERRLIRREADAAVVVADDPEACLSAGALASLQSIPTILIAPRASDREDITVAMNTSTPGIHAGGTVLRCDGAALPLRPALASDLPSERDWLRAIRERWESIP